MPIYNSNENDVLASLEEAYREMLTEKPYRGAMADDDGGARNIVLSPGGRMGTGETDSADQRGPDTGMGGAPSRPAGTAKMPTANTAMIEVIHLPAGVKSAMGDSPLKLSSVTHMDCGIEPNFSGCKLFSNT